MTHHEEVQYFVQGQTVLDDTIIVAFLPPWLPPTIFYSPYREPWKYLRKAFWASSTLNHTQFTQQTLLAGRNAFSIFLKS